MAELRIQLFNHENPPLKKSNYANRISETRWEIMKPVIAEMFQQGLTQAQMLSRLQSGHDFRPSRAQLVARMHQWYLRRYKPRETVYGAENENAASVRRSSSPDKWSLVGSLKRLMNVDSIKPPVRKTFRHYNAQSNMKLHTDNSHDGEAAWLLAALLRSGAVSPITGLDIVLALKYSPFISREYVDREEIFQRLQKGLSHTNAADKYQELHLVCIVWLTLESFFLRDDQALKVHKQGTYIMLSGLRSLRDKNIERDYDWYAKLWRYLDAFQHRRIRWQWDDTEVFKFFCRPRTPAAAQPLPLIEFLALHRDLPSPVSELLNLWVALGCLLT